jgi:hypothetical protein
VKRSLEPSESMMRAAARRAAIIFQPSMLCKDGERVPACVDGTCALNSYSC